MSKYYFRRYPWTYSWEKIVKDTLQEKLSSHEKAELFQFLTEISVSELQAFQTIAETELLEAGVIEPKFDTVSTDPVKNESYYEGSDALKIDEFAVIKAVFENGLIPHIVTDDTVSFYIENMNGRFIEL